MFTPVTVVTASVSVLPGPSHSPLGAFIDEENETQESGSLPKDSAA